MAAGLEGRGEKKRALVGEAVVVEADVSEGSGSRRVLQQLCEEHSSFVGEAVVAKMQLLDDAVCSKRGQQVTGSSVRDCVVCEEDLRD